MREEKQKNKKRRWGLWCAGIVGFIGLVGIIAVGGFFIYIASLMDGASMCDSVSRTPAGIEQQGHIELPEDIQNFEVDCSGFMDSLALDVQFEVDAEDLEEVQAGIEMIETWADTPLLTDEMLRPLDGVINRRAIERMNSYVYGASEFNRYVVLVDTSDSEKYVVYLAILFNF
ncbi:MAG: hypothetical protein AAFV98_07830 [Chloroflexota bacterium]